MFYREELLNLFFSVISCLQEQEKAQVIKSVREAEQERQWKNLQAFRQQQLLSQNRQQGKNKS